MRYANDEGKSLFDVVFIDRNRSLCAIQKDQFAVVERGKKCQINSTWSAANQYWSVTEFAVE